MERFTPSVAEALRARFGEIVVRADHSWGDTSTKVIEIEAGGQACIVKTFGPENQHFERELLAHSQFLAALRDRGAVPELLHVDEEERFLVTAYLPGDLVEDYDAEDRPDTYRQAGELLALFHGETRKHSSVYMDRVLSGMRRRLDAEHRISSDTRRRIERALDSITPEPVALVPCHGDFQPRNWLVHHGEVFLIDFGRSAWRTPETDLSRLAAQQFRNHPEREEAFRAGYGEDLRASRLWSLSYLEEAVGASVYAYRIGCEAFEAQGHRMIQVALQLFEE